MSDQESLEGTKPLRSLPPPHLVLTDFLDDGTAAGLLDHALTHQSAFAPTKVSPRGDTGAIISTIRVSAGTRDLGPYREIFRSKALELLPKLIGDLRLSPFEATWVETELVAHNDGAFFRRHIDTQTGYDRRRLRVVSAVYYFHTRPRAFTGGALRLHDIAGGPSVDIEPTHNSLVVFPAWAPHEVMRVSCPSQRFADSRFAVNCWIYRDRQAAADDSPR